MRSNRKMAHCAIMKKMKISTHKGAVFALAVFFSVFVHLVVLACMGDVAFPDLPGPHIFIASLVTETPHVTPLHRSFQDNAGGYDERMNSLAEDTPSAAGGQQEEGKDKGKSPVEEISSSSARQVSHDAVHHEETAGEERAASGDIREKGASGPEGHEVDPSGPSREKLSFDLYWLGIYVGNAVLEAVVRDNTMTITTEAHSAPFISNFYKVEDYSESRIVDGRPVSFKIRQREGKYRSNKETRFDVMSRKVAYFDYLKDLRNEQEFRFPHIWDVVSGFYHLRTQQLEIGKTVYIDVFDSDKFLSVEVNVLRKEKVDVPGRGEIDAIIVNPLLKSEGLFQKKGDILVWLTDDGNRTPVRVETEVPIGKVVAKLKGMEVEQKRTTANDL